MGQIEREDEKVKQQQDDLVQISMEMLKQRGKENLVIKVICTIVIVLMILINSFIVYMNYQFKEEMLQYISTLEAETTTETTTTQTVDGEGKINNVDGNQYNDSATHNDNRWKNDSNSNN